MPSWTAVEERSRTNPGSAVELKRMPVKLKALRDMKTWRRSELDAFTGHILAGQRGELSESQIFQWREVPGKRGTVTRIAQGYEKLPHATSKLRYTKLEILYAQRVAIEMVPTSDVAKWNGLPLARTTHIYPAYSMELYTSLRQMHQDNSSMIQLIDSIATLERYGPVHVSYFDLTADCELNPQQRLAGLSDVQELRNAHIPPSSLGSLAGKLSPAEILPLAFFDRHSTEHTSWSISTLLAWISVQQAFVHAESSTVLAGPTGVRTIVFALSRILQSIKAIGSGEDLPEAIRRVTRGHNATWSAVRALSMTNQCISEMQRHVLRTTVVLQVTYEDRSSAWESAVEERYCKWDAAGQPAETTPAEGINATSGLPASIQAVSGMRRAIEKQAATRQDPDETVQASIILGRTARVQRPARRQVLSMGSQSGSSDEMAIGEPTGTIPTIFSENIIPPLEKVRQWHCD